MRFRQIDVVGYQTGALVAAELALALPTVVRRVVLMGVPVPDEDERESFGARHGRLAAVADGSHLQLEWNRVRTSVHERARSATVAAGFADKLANGPNAWWGLHAAMQYRRPNACVWSPSRPCCSGRAMRAGWTAAVRAN